MSVRFALMGFLTLLPSGCDDKGESNTGSNVDEAGEVSPKPDGKTEPEEKPEPDGKAEPDAKPEPEPKPEPTPEPEPEPPADDPNASRALSLEVSSPNEVIPLRLAANVKLGKLGEKYNRVYAKAVCKLGDVTYVDIERELSPKPDSTLEMEGKFFSGKAWTDEGPLGDCDVWLTLREGLGDRQYNETLLATTCRRGSAWKSEGCTEFPKAVAPDPIDSDAVDVSIHSAKPEKERKGHVLKVYVEYTAKQNVHAAYELAADVQCSAGAKTARFSDDINGVDLNELRPTHRARGFIPEPYKEEELLPVPPERCTLDFHLLKTMGPDEKLPITKSFCWEAGKPVSEGKCPTK